MVAFEEKSKDYIRELEKEPYLGAVQTIIGKVIKLAPGPDIVEIRRSGGRKVKVYLERPEFDLVRYGQTRNARIKVTGRPRFRIGAETRIFSEFEGMKVVLLNDRD